MDNMTHQRMRGVTTHDAQRVVAHAFQTDDAVLAAVELPRCPVCHDGIALGIVITDTGEQYRACKQCIASLYES
jgi:hypothetical protein